MVTKRTAPSAMRAEPTVICTRRLRGLRRGRDARGSADMLLAPSGRRLSRIEDIAHPPHRLDALGIGGVALHLLAERAHMDVHGAAVAQEIVSPDAAQQLLAGEDVLGGLAKDEQEVILLGSQLHA